MRGVFSRACVEAIAGGARDCDICGMRFSPTPHAHLPGNMFLARCGYISRLLPPEGFRRKMDALYRSLNVKLGHLVGKGRWSSEHWPGSHPSVRACDVLDSAYDSGYSQFPRDAYPIKWALAPRYRNGHPYRTRLKRNVRDVVAEWRAVYNETAPASSLLLRHYVETRQPPIDTRRPGRPGKKNADLPRRKKKSAFQGRPAAAPRPPRKNWSPREVAAAIADEVGRNH